MDDMNDADLRGFGVMICYGRWALAFEVARDQFVFGLQWDKGRVFACVAMLRVGVMRLP